MGTAAGGAASDLMVAASLVGAGSGCGAGIGKGADTTRVLPSSLVWSWLFMEQWERIRGEHIGHESRVGGMRGDGIPRISGGGWEEF